MTNFIRHFTPSVKNYHENEKKIFQTFKHNVSIWMRVFNRQLSSHSLFIPIFLSSVNVFNFGHRNIHASFVSNWAKKHKKNSYNYKISIFTNLRTVVRMTKKLPRMIEVNKIKSSLEENFAQPKMHFLSRFRTILLIKKISYGINFR